VAIAAAAAVGAIAAPGGATAVAAKADLFSCWTRPLTVVEKGTPTTNPDKQMCQNDQVGASASAGSAGSVKVSAKQVAGSTSRTVTALRTESTASTTDSAVAQASAGSARLTVGSTVVDLGAMTSKTTITCTYSAKTAKYSFSSTSSVKSLKINGKPVTVQSGPMDIKLNGGTLRLNHTDKTAIGITQHAALLVTKKAEVVIGESAVSLSKAPKNPCHS
jgi:hypothetical protein